MQVECARNAVKEAKLNADDYEGYYNRKVMIARDALIAAETEAAFYKQQCKLQLDNAHDALLAIELNENNICSRCIVYGCCYSRTDKEK